MAPRRGCRGTTVAGATSARRRTVRLGTVAVLLVLRARLATRLRAGEATRRQGELCARAEDEAGAADKIAGWGEKIQCVGGHGHIPFGKAQKPALWEYADGVNTMAFLASL